LETARRKVCSCWRWSAINKPGSTDARLALVAISKLAMVKAQSATQSEVGERRL
jgi:hypothetical protein